MSLSQNNSSSLISSLYHARKTLLQLMKHQGYNIKEYENFSINEVNTMFQTKQLDMLMEKTEPKPESQRNSKIYICFYLAKTIRPQNIQDMMDDLFQMEEILTKDDILYIVVKDDINETLTNLLKHIWEQDKIFIVMQNIKRLQFNILEHALVPKHRILNEYEIKQVKAKYNITSDSQIPDISRFDPVAQAICIRPGEICEIQRPSKTAILSLYYRICIS